MVRLGVFTGVDMNTLGSGTRPGTPVIAGERHAAADRGARVRVSQPSTSTALGFGIAMLRHRQHTDGEIDVASTADTAAVHVERLSRHEGRVIASQEPLDGGRRSSRVSGTLRQIEGLEFV
jgi:hypothetical protein